MIKHIVMLDLAADHDPAELQLVMTGLDDLRHSVSGFTHFEHGENRDFENMSPSCSYLFICHFDGEDTSRAYLVNKDHQALGKRLVGLCKGGVSGVTVVDLDVAE